MLHTVVSKGAKTIRLTDERWAHITDEHCELAGLRTEVLGAIAEPDKIVAGGYGELLAVKETRPAQFLIVVYRELEMDGFVITAFLTSKVESVLRRKQIWP